MITKLLQAQQCIAEYVASETGLMSGADEACLRSMLTIIPSIIDEEEKRLTTHAVNMASVIMEKRFEGMQ